MIHSRRKEAWRFVSYMFLHGSYEHITFNCLMQLLVGIPIEMSQLGWIGSLRVATLYLSGVLLGALGASISEPNKYMLGASAGVYALIAAHLGTLLTFTYLIMVSLLQTLVQDYCKLGSTSLLYCLY